jgi:zinc/manganese transport system substrate-binding protein
LTEDLDMPPRSTAVIGLALSIPLLGTACSTSQAASPGVPGGAVTAIGAENEYASVISQLGGTYVRVSAVLSNPNTDPHTFESSASVTQQVSGAQLVVQNGVGYDSFMNKIEAAAPSSARTVIDVQNLLRLPDSTPNPHLWYSPSTMPAVARAVTAALSRLQPAHAAFFAASLRRFDASLQPWYRAIAQFKAAYPGTPVATTEPVADYMLQAAGTRNLTPFSFQADIMNGVDPSPQDVSLQDSLFSGHKVKVFLYNQQVTDTLTESFLSQARKNGIPVVGVYETMPAPGYDYQSWMLAEITALRKAVADKISTQKL